MRTRRLNLSEAAIYHCMSRTVNGEAYFQDREKEMFRKMIWKVADFSGVEILTYCVMKNHFHVLVRVVPDQEVSDVELIRRYRVLYPNPTAYETASIAVLESELAKDTDAARDLRVRLLSRMGNVSEFMKTLKQRFSIWFNKSRDRYGPVWSDRFKSVLVEGKGFPLQTMAAYIDLNAVRAGLVEDPKDYRFCGYAEAVVGKPSALDGLRFLTCGEYEMPLKECLQSYRLLLFGKGARAVSDKTHLSRADAVRVLEREDGVLPTPTLLRCRVRYFTDGAILGSQEFIQSHLADWQRQLRRKYPPIPRSIGGTGTRLFSIKGRRRGGYS